MNSLHPTIYNAILLLPQNDIDLGKAVTYQACINSIFSTTPIQWQVHVRSVEASPANIIPYEKHRFTHLIVGINVLESHVEKVETVFRSIRSLSNVNRCLGMLMTIPADFSGKIEEVSYEILSLDSEFIYTVHRKVQDIDSIRVLFGRKVAGFVPLLPVPAEDLARERSEPPYDVPLTLSGSSGSLKLGDSRGSSAASSSESMQSNPEGSQGKRLLKIVWRSIPHLLDAISVIAVRIVFPQLRNVHVLGLGLSLGALTTWSFKYLNKTPFFNA